MKTLTLQSPAKVNLDLRILGRYANGYHKLFTLFHRISICDTLRLVPRRHGVVIRCHHSAVPLDQSNIIAKAYQLLLERWPNLPGVTVYLTKRIPVAAGLGGGSSNAAAFLLGMKKLFSLRISQPELMALGGKLGADVPFFVANTTQAFGRDIGDSIEPVLSKVNKWFVLITSDQGLSTRDVYLKLPRRLPAASLTKLERTARIATHFLDRLALEKVDQILTNDLEKPAFKLQPAIQKIIQKAVTLGASLVRMSGSGPTVFAVFPNQNEARIFARRIRQVLKNKVIICHSY